MNLTDNPTLDEGDVLRGGNFDGDLIVVQPGVRMTTRRGLVQGVKEILSLGDLPASGHDWACLGVANGKSSISVYLLNALEQ